MTLDYDTYFEYHDQSYIIIEKVAHYYDLELKDLRWKHFKDFAIDVENIDIIPYNFGEMASQRLSGNIIRFGDQIGISYNPTMIIGRQHFSILHELGHYFFDMTTTIRAQTFSDLLYENGYSKEDEPKELRANIFASLALINNEALKECFRKNLTFQQMCYEFQVSQAALYMRIYDFLTKLFYLDSCLARQSLNQFRYSGKHDKIYSYIKMGL